MSQTPFSALNKNEFIEIAAVIWALLRRCNKAQRGYIACPKSHSP